VLRYVKQMVDMPGVKSKVHLQLILLYSMRTKMDFIRTVMIPVRLV
jgi:hypothetical protein